MKKKANPTPGPWEHVSRVKLGRKIFRVFGNDGATLVCDSPNVSAEDNPLEDHYPEQEANARLIAAAPEMLEALEQVVAYAPADITSEFMQRVTSLIAKAKGK